MFSDVTEVSILEFKISTALHSQIVHAGLNFFFMGYQSVQADLKVWIYETPCDNSISLNHSFVDYIYIYIYTK